MKHNVEGIFHLTKGLSRKISKKQAAQKDFISSESLESARLHLHTSASKLKSLSKIYVMALVGVQHVADTTPKTAQRSKPHI